MALMRSKSTLHKVATRNTVGGIRVAGTSKDASAQLIARFRTFILYLFLLSLQQKTKVIKKRVLHGLGF
jgi:hypothetical protein